MNLENIHENENSKINLKNLEFNFCEDDFIENYYNEKVKETEKKRRMGEETSSFFTEKAKLFQKLVEEGIIPNTQPDTIWQYNLKKLKSASSEVIEIKDNLSNDLPQIIKKIKNKLSLYLPNWKAQKANIDFTINEQADFQIDLNIITIDLSRLIFAENPKENLTQGLSHELFHFWIKGNNDWADYKINEYSNKKIKEHTLFKIIDEGLAVLISGQSLKEHHEKQGSNYLKLEEKSFHDFAEFQKENDHEKILAYSEKFKNMGEFYVVGYKIVKTTLQKLGIEKFKKMIIETKNGNPNIFIDEYKKII